VCRPNYSVLTSVPVYICRTSVVVNFYNFISIFVIITSWMLMQLLLFCCFFVIIISAGGLAFRHSMLHCMSMSRDIDVAVLSVCLFICHMLLTAIRNVDILCCFLLTKFSNSV